MASLPQYQDALELDLTVLQALLKRNQHSHGRTLYFQRMSMAWRAIQRHEIMSVTVESLQQALQKYSKNREQWSVEGRDPLADIQKQVREIVSLLEKGVPEITSRIDHATEALFVEVARGFFLPLCVVALGCLARIRILVLRNARKLVLDLQRLILGEYKQLADVTALVDPSFFETTLERFLEPSMQLQQTSRLDVDRTLQSLGMTRKGKKRSESASDVGNTTVVGDDVVDDDDGTDKITTISTTVAKKPPPADDDDLGESVAMLQESDATMKPDLPLPISTGASLHAQDVSDKNLQFLDQLKTTSSTGKRSREQSPCDKSKKKKKRKKESKKKKRKDVFDEIFGD